MVMQLVQHLRVIGQTLESTETLGQAEHFHGLQKRSGLRQTAFDVKRQHAAETAGLTQCDRVLGMRRQTGMQYPIDKRMPFQEPGHGQPALHVLLHAHVQRLQAAVHHVTVER